MHRARWGSVCSIIGVLNKRVMASLVFDVKDGRSVYKRCRSVLCRELESALGERYGHPTQAVVTSSGMEAITTALIAQAMAWSKRRCSIVIAEELYDETSFAVSYVFNCLLAGEREDAVDIHVVSKSDMASAHGYLDAIRATTHPRVIVFAEIASNPCGIDFPLKGIVNGLAGVVGKEVCIIVDNTWLTSAACNPFLDGASIVVSSLTKHYSGGGAIGGVVVCANADVHAAALLYRESLGSHVSDANIRVVLDALPTLDERVRSAAAAADVIVGHVTKMQTPAGDFRVVQRSNNLLSTVILVATQTDDAKALLAAIRDADQHPIDVMTSYGGPHVRVEDDTFDTCVPECLGIRIAFGYADDTDAVLRVHFLLCVVYGVPDLAVRLRDEADLNYQLACANLRLRRNTMRMNEHGGWTWSSAMWPDEDTKPSGACNFARERTWTVVVDME